MEGDKPAQSLRFKTKADFEAALRNMSKEPEPSKRLRAQRSRRSVQGVFQYLCEPCRDDEQSVSAVVFCQNCTKYMCEECKNADQKLYRGKNRHTFVERSFEQSLDQNEVDGDGQNELLTICKLSRRPEDDITCTSEEFTGKEMMEGDDEMGYVNYKLIERVSCEQSKDENQTDDDGTDEVSLIHELNPSLEDDITCSSEKLTSEEAHLHTTDVFDKEGCVEKSNTFSLVGSDSVEQLLDERQVLVDDDEKGEESLPSYEITYKYEKLSSKETHFCRAEDFDREIITPAVDLTKLKVFEGQNSDQTKKEGETTDKLDQSSMKIVSDEIGDNRFDRIFMQPSDPEFVSFVEKIEVCEPETEDECDISDIVFSPDGDIILSDTKNESLKVITANIENRLLKLESWPWNLAVSSVCKKGVYVTLPDIKKIFLINIDQCLTKSKIISTVGDCWGIVCTCNALIVSIWDEYQSEGFIQLLDFEGRIQATLKNEACSQSCLSGSCYLTINESETMLYVTDSESKAINLIELEDNKMKTKDIFRENDFGFLCGIAVDTDDDIYVIDVQKKYLYKLNTGTYGPIKSNIILSHADGLAHPRCVCYDKFNRLLYIGGYTDFIMVYKLHRNLI